MAPADMVARLRFLDEASEVLTVAAPTVSSYMQATKRDAASSKETRAATSKDVCNACSQRLVLGWSCQPVRSGEHRQTRQQSISGKASTTKCVKCSACSTENTIQHQKKKRTNEHKSQVLARKAKTEVALPVEQPMLVSLPEPTPVPSPIPSSKEQTPEIASTKPTARRKVRGKNATLQALLANKKPEAPKSSGFGLDFMDFMK